MKKYNLTFQEALQEVMEGNGWMQGEDFAEGVVFMIGDSFGLKGRPWLFMHDFKSNHQADPIITSGVYNQKFRIVQTQPDAMKK